MRDSLTATQLAILRSPKQWSHLYVAVHKPQTLFSARLSGAPSSYPASALAFASGTPTSGTVPAGTTVYIGSSAGARDKGMLRVRSDLTMAATGSISVAEFGDKLINLATNDYLTIVEDYRPAPKFPRYSGGAWYVDYDVAYDSSVSKQNDNYGPLARLGPPAIGFLVGGHCYLKYVGERSAAYSPSNAIDTWAWAFPDASSSSSEGTTASPIEVDYTAAIPSGEYHSLTVTEDTTNKTHTGRRLTFVFERTGSNAPYEAAIIGRIQGGPGQGGYTADLRILNTAAAEADFPTGAHVVVFEEAYYADEDGVWFETDDITDPGGVMIAGQAVTGNNSGATGEIVSIGNGYIKIAVTAGEFTPGELIFDDVPATATLRIYAPNIGGNYPYRTNVVMDAWVTSERVSKNPFTGAIEFSIGTLDAVLKTLEGYPVALTNRSTTPALDWESYKRTTMNTATLHFVLWRSTIAAITDVEFQEYGPPNTAIMKYVTLDKGSLFDQLNGYWQRTMLGWVTCDLQSALYCEMDAVIDETVRAQVPTAWTVTKDSDLRDELEIRPTVIDPNSQTVLYAVAYRKPLGSKSPGDPHGYEGVTVEITDGIAGPLVGGDVSSPDQSTLSTWAGNLRAKTNNLYPAVPHQLAGNWRIDPVPQCYFIESFSSGDTVRGITLTSQKFIPRSLRLTFNTRSYSLLADVDADAETIGIGGVAIEFPDPEEPVIELPPPPPPPPPIEPLPTADATEVWLFHYNAASTPVNAIIYSTDFFSSLGSPTWNVVANLPANLAFITGGYVRPDGTQLYLVGSDSGSGQVSIWRTANPKAGTVTWSQDVQRGYVYRDIDGVSYAYYGVIDFMETHDGYQALVEVEPTPTVSIGPVVVANTNGALTSTITGVLGNALYMNANNVIGVKYPHRTLYEAGIVRQISGGDYLTWAPDTFGLYTQINGASVPWYTSGLLTYGSGLTQLYYSLAANPIPVGGGSKAFSVTWRTAIAGVGAPEYVGGAPYGWYVYALMPRAAGTRESKLYYSHNGYDFVKTSDQYWTQGRVLSADLSGGTFAIWVLCRPYYQANASSPNVTNGNEFIRYCADISDVAANPWTAAVGNMWSGGGAIISSGDLTLKAAALVYA